MVDRLEDVWTWRDYPVLLAIATAVDQDEWIGLHELARATGLSLDDCFRAVRALESAGYVLEPMYSSGPDVNVGHISGAAYQVTGLHPDPTDTASSLVHLLEQAADAEPDPGKRARLRKAAAAIGDVGGQVVGNVMAAILTRMAGL